jgi:uroporphyrinogen-III decarboxylase
LNYGSLADTILDKTRLKKGLTKGEPMAMTHKQRILAAVRGEKVDKLPFGARIDLWYNYHSWHDTLPSIYRGCSMPAILHTLGAGIQMRHPAVWKVEYRDTEVIINKQPPFTTREYRTPKGTVSMKTMFTPKEGTIVEYETEMLFKSADDYPAIEHLIENTVLIPHIDDYLKTAKMIGEDGIAIVQTSYSPMQEIMRKIMGYENFFFELNDHSGKVENLYELMKQVVWQKLKILADSPVEIVQVCSNWSDDIHTPIFKQYFIPWFREAVEFLHSKGKQTLVHADGELRRLVPMFVETGINIAEAVSPAPMTSVTTAELRKAWGDSVIIWGGVPAILFEPQYTDEEFDSYVKTLFHEIAPGNNFIVGMGDNVGFEGKIERVGRIVELIDKYGNLPMSV